MGMSKAVSGKAHGALAGLALGLASLGLGGCGSSSDEDTYYVEMPVEVLSRGPGIGRSRALHGDRARLGGRGNR